MRGNDAPHPGCPAWMYVPPQGCVKHGLVPVSRPVLCPPRPSSPPSPTGFPLLSALFSPCFGHFLLSSAPFWSPVSSDTHTHCFAVCICPNSCVCVCVCPPFPYSLYSANSIIRSGWCFHGLHCDLKTHIVVLDMLCLEGLLLLDLFSF